MESEEETFELNLHDIDYIITLWTGANSLFIEAE